jgi:tRNA (cytidine/uridine-2'-O-)-methyltransferase
MELNIVLVEPEIPQNTGNIARTCAATGSKLHLIKPLGFSIDEKQVRRAGLDYWKDVDIFTYENLDEFLYKNKNKQMYFVTTKATMKYSDVTFPKECFLLFGKETAGLPKWLLDSELGTCIRIPMLEGQRSLNLSNAVGIVAYEVLRQNGFKGLV